MCRIKHHPNIDPRAFTGPYYVVDSLTGLGVQSEDSAKRANDAVETLNAHEARNGRPAIYVMRLQGVERA